MGSTPRNHMPDDDSLTPFYSEEAAYRFVERCVWPAGVICPHCGDASRSRPLRGASTRIGAYKCYACRKPFTVKVGTLLESSNLPMHKWLQAIFLTHRKGEAINANVLHHTLDITPRTASFVLHRVRQQSTDRLQRHFKGVTTTAAPDPVTRRRPAAGTASRKT